MKRDNRVLLDGTLSVLSAESIDMDGQGRLIARCLVQTDLKDLGGHHQVVVYDRLAVEALAFVQAMDKEPIEVTLDGWLHSNGLSWVVADRMTFHVSSTVRAKAARIINQMIKGEADYRKILPAK